MPHYYTSTFSSAFAFTIKFYLFGFHLIKMYIVSAVQEPNPTLQGSNFIEKEQLQLASALLANLFLHSLHAHSCSCQF
jgi:hypothetical protein